MSGRKNIADRLEGKWQPESTREREETEYLKVGSQYNCHPWDAQGRLQGELSRKKFSKTYVY